MKPTTIETQMHQRGSVLRRLLTGPRRDLVLLTATPVNNSLWDFVPLGSFFIKQDAFLADRGILSMRQRFEQVMRTDPARSQSGHALSDHRCHDRQTNATSSRNTTSMTSSIRGPDGNLMPIRFPKPVVSTLEYNFDDVLPGFFDRFENDLTPSNGPPRVNNGPIPAGAI